MLRNPLRVVAAPAFVWMVLAACVASQGPTTVPPYEYRSRIRDVSVGQPIEEARDVLGNDRVRKPNHPDEPFPSPLAVLELVARDGRQIRVESYVIDAWRAKGCPDFHYRDVPVTYVDDKVASIGWDELEWEWSGWGGSLAELRAAQDRFVCDDPGPDVQPSSETGSTSSVRPFSPTTRIREPAGSGPASAATRAIHSSDPTFT